MKHLVLMLAWICFACFLKGQEQGYLIDKPANDVPLNHLLTVLELETDTPSLSEIQRPEWQGRFVPYSDFIKKYLPETAAGKVLLDPRKVYWWKVHLRNGLDMPIRDWVLHTGRSNFTEVYFVGENGQLLATKHTGWLMPTAEKDFLMGNRQAERVAFRLEEGAAVTVYGRVSVVNGKEPFIRVQLSGEDYYKNWGFIEKTRIEWTAIGSLLTFILFNLLFYATTRDQVFFWHSLYLTGIFLYLLEFFNVLPDLAWWRDHRIFSQVFIYAALCLMDVAYLQFIRTFMGLDRSHPDWGRRFRWFVAARVAFAVGVIAYFLASYNMKTSDDLTAAFLVGEYLLMIGLLFYLFGWKNKQGRFLIAGTAVFVVAIVINAFAVIKGIGLIFSFTQFGVMGEVVLFTLGLGYRMKRLIREQREAERLKDLDEFKSRFYTNITHEFRTPLTVIMGNAELGKSEVEKFAKTGTPAPPAPDLKGLVAHFNGIARNANQLLRLINRLLDLSKLQSGKMPLLLKQGDVVAYLRYLVESFRSLAASRDIHLRFRSDPGRLDMDFDAEKMQDIFSNLVSNALKFSGPGSEVSVSVGLLPKGPAHGERLCITVKDQGTGIAPDMLPHVFDRFNSAKDTGNPAGGTGVGLALTKELTELMGGQISAASRPGEGAEFTVTLPVTRQAEMGGTPAPAIFQNIDFQGNNKPLLPLPVPSDGHEKPLCLVVDDNADVVEYLQNLLANEYEVLTAFDGQKGIDKALEHLPDVVISDVMMPEKDGLALCDFLKNDERTSHIPIILLTAKASVEARLEGLRRGADAYLEKPFNREELFVCLKKSVELRQRLTAHFSKITTAEPTPPATDPGLVIEDAFLQKARAAIEKNLSDDRFDLHVLCRLLALSRAQLHRKLTALTGQSATHFIRSVRLAKAKELLASTDLTISEIAYEVGFHDPNYFSRTFAEEFGEAPSETRK